MVDEDIEKMVEEFVRLNDELYARGLSPMKIIRDRTAHGLVRGEDGRMCKKVSNHE